MLCNKEELQLSKKENHKGSPLLLVPESRAAKRVTFRLMTYLGSEDSRITGKSLKLTLKNK